MRDRVRGKLNAPTDGHAEEELVRDGEEGVGGVQSSTKGDHGVLPGAAGVFRLRRGIKEFYSAIWDALLGAEEIWAALFSNHMLVKKQTGT